LYVDGILKMKHKCQQDMGGPLDLVEHFDNPLLFIVRRIRLGGVMIVMTLNSIKLSVTPETSAFFANTPDKPLEGH
jgi:hypothetical protein